MSPRDVGPSKPDKPMAAPSGNRGQQAAPREIDLAQLDQLRAAAGENLEEVKYNPVEAEAAAREVFR